MSNLDRSDSRHHIAPFKSVNKTLLRIGKLLGRKRFWKRAIIGSFSLVLLCTTVMYSVALWYQHSQAGKAYQLGVTFIPSYATYLGVDPQETLNAITTDLGVKHFRFTSYWDEIEPSQGQYNFTTLDWEMQAAEKAGATVSLTIGLRQPRWPECHTPDWVDTLAPATEWQPALERYMTAVINRYKSSSSLQSYQLENEFFNGFGECHNFDRSRLISEFDLVKRLDSKHPIIISRSNNYAGFATGQPRADITGLSVYRKVYSPWVKGYFTYPFPSWYYAFLAGAQQILTGKPSVIHELQTEPWLVDGQDLLSSSLSDQDKTFDAAQLKTNVTFAKQTGIRQIDLWGPEYWYYRKQVLHDSSVWDTAQTVFKNTQ